MAIDERQPPPPPARETSSQAGIVPPDAFARVKAALQQQIDERENGGTGTAGAAVLAPPAEQFDEELMDTPVFLRGKMSEPQAPRQLVHPSDIQPEDATVSQPVILATEDELDEPTFARGKVSSPQFRQFAHSDDIAPEDAPSNSQSQIPERTKGPAIFEDDSQPKPRFGSTSSPTGSPKPSSAEAGPPMPDKPRWGEAIFKAEDEIPGSELIPADKKALATKTWNFLKASAIAQKENLTHVKGREAEWYLGVAAGSALSITFQAASLNPFASTAAKVGMNAAVGIGVTQLLEHGYIKERASYYNKFTGEELKTKISKLEQDHEKAKGRIKNFMLGVSAGATYTSVASLGFHALGGDQLVNSFMEGWNNAHQAAPVVGVEINVPNTPVAPEAVAQATAVHVSTPEPTTVPTLEPTHVPTPEPTVAPTVEPTAVPTVAPTVTTPEAYLPTGAPGIQESVAALQAHTAPDVSPAITAATGADAVPGAVPHLAPPDVTPGLHDAGLDSHLGNAGTITHEATGAGLHAIRESATSNMSAEVLGTNHAFQEIVAPHVGEHLNLTDQAVSEALKAQGLDPSQVSDQVYEQMRLAAQHQLEAAGNESFAQAVKETALNGQIDYSHAAERGTQLFNEAVTQSGQHDRLVQAAHDVLNQQVSADNQIHETIQNVVNNLSPEEKAAHLIRSGETFSHLAAQSGHSLSFEPNPTNADYLGAHALANFDKISNFHAQVTNAIGTPSHLPFGQAELPGIIEQARAGDQTAMSKLVEFWKFIPANDNIDMLTDSGVENVLKGAGVSR